MVELYVCEGGPHSTTAMPQQLLSMPILPQPHLNFNPADPTSFDKNLGQTPIVEYLGKCESPNFPFEFSLSGYSSWNKLDFVKFRLCFWFETMQLDM